MWWGALDYLCPCMGVLRAMWHSFCEKFSKFVIAQSLFFYAVLIFARFFYFSEEN